jgi:5-methylcytosine-specific restriction endonuclease McrA
LIRLAPLVRPLVELHWTRAVADFTKVARVEAALHDHLFRPDRRLPPKSLRDWMTDLQDGRCFHCDKTIHREPEADHFIARVRCAIDAIENLVMADRSCNADKKDLLPAPTLVERWAARNRHNGPALSDRAKAANWETDLVGTQAVARSIYAHLPTAPSPSGRGHLTPRLTTRRDHLRLRLRPVADGPSDRGVRDPGAEPMPTWAEGGSEFQWSHPPGPPTGTGVRLGGFVTDVIPVANALCPLRPTWSDVVVVCRDNAVEIGADLSENSIYDPVGDAYSRHDDTIRRI